MSLITRLYNIGPSKNRVFVLLVLGHSVYYKHTKNSKFCNYTNKILVIRYFQDTIELCKIES